MTDWDRLVQDYGPSVFGTAWRILGHAADAEDVVQDVFLEVHRLWRTRPVKHWGGLLRRLSTSRSLDRLRRRKPMRSFDDLEPIAYTPGPEQITMGKELVARLRSAIAELPERESSVFCLRYFEDLSYQSIAETLDISSGAVAAALHKARARLEEMLTEVIEGEH